MKYFMATLSLLLLSACTSEVPELKSPCVGAKGSPCDDRFPVNDQWMTPVSFEV